MNEQLLDEYPQFTKILLPYLLQASMMSTTSSSSGGPEEDVTLQPDEHSEPETEANTIIVDDQEVELRVKGHNPVVTLSGAGGGGEEKEEEGEKEGGQEDKKGSYWV